MRETLERELKLEPDVGFAMPDLPGESLEPRVFTSTYYDTPPHSLARCGITLRCRVEDGVARWQLKLPRDSARAELEWTGVPEAPPDEIRELLVAHRAYGELQPVATLRTRRVGVRVVSGDRSLADVVVDSVDVLGNGEVEAFSEIEVELVDGDEADLDRLSRVLQRAGAHRTKGLPKLMRVLELDGEVAPLKEASAAVHLRFLLVHQLRELETYDPGVRLGVEPEDLHRFRVATRRSRALIRASSDLVGGQLTALQEELRWLGGVLGAVRDLDVLIEHLREVVDGLDEDAAGGQPIVAALVDERDADRAAMLEALGSERYFALLERFRADVEQLGGLASDIRLEDIARDEAKRLQRAHAKLDSNPPDEQLHRLRIKAKRLRYAAELAAETEGKRLGALASAATELQDLIGSHQDAVVAEERVRALAAWHPGFAAGRVVEQERARRRAARAELPATWKRVDRAIDRAF